MPTRGGLPQNAARRAQDHREQRVQLQIHCSCVPNLLCSSMLRTYLAVAHSADVPTPSTCLIYRALAIVLQLQVSNHTALVSGGRCRLVPGTCPGRNYLFGALLHNSCGLFMAGMHRPSHTLPGLRSEAQFLRNAPMHDATLLVCTCAYLGTDRFSSGSLPWFQTVLCGLQQVADLTNMWMVPEPPQ